MSARTSICGIVLSCLILSVALIACTSPVSGTGGAESEAKIFGTALFADSTPAINVPVFLRDGADTALGSGRPPRAYTDSAGRFEIDSCAPGAYLIEVAAEYQGLPNGALREHVVTEPSSGEQQRVTIFLEPSATIIGRIEGLESLPEITVAVTLYYRDFAVSATRADSAGAFLFDGLAGGAYALRFEPSAPPYLPFTYAIDIAAGDTAEAVIGGLIANIGNNPDYAADSMVIRELLDSNGLTTPVGSVTSVSHDFRITELNLESSTISMLPNSASRLTKLRSVNLRNNQLTAFPTALLACSSLTILNLDDNRIQSLPNDMGGLVSLKILRLSGNRLKALPESIGELSALTELTLAQNALTSLPESVGGLVHLQTLSVQSNRLRALPAAIGACTGLHTLTIHDNAIAELPESIGALTDLRKLTIANNFLSHLPRAIGDLAALDMLWASDNLLDSLPASIGDCGLLRFLTLSGNQLRTLPSSLGALGRLHELALDSNLLASIPDSLATIRSLRVLDLSHNALCSSSPAAAAWADSLDPDWRQSQRCSGGPQSPITIVSPTPGDTFIQGDIVHIQWETITTPGYAELAMEISISLDGGYKWIPIPDGGEPVTVNSPQWGDCAWKIPDSLQNPDGEHVSSLSNSCLIRLSDYTNPVFSAVMDNEFTIDGPPIDLVTPNRGAYAIGDTMAVNWETLSDKIVSVACSLSIDNGETWLPIISRPAITVNDSDWQAVRWVVPDSLYDQSRGTYRSVVSERCLIRVSDYIGCAYGDCFEDRSDSAFAITKP
jgi:Leucine-rich repeat (LRR) protein